MRTASKKCVLFLLILAWICVNHYFCFASEINSVFSKEKPADWLPNLPKRLTISGLRGIPDVLTCALQSANKNRGSQGFLYHFDSGLCTPLLWLEGPLSPTALPAQTGEGDLYLAKGWCLGDDFQLLELQTGELVCLYHAMRYATYDEASFYCASADSYLASVKTLVKLEMVRSLARVVNVWVGIDSLSGPMIWQSDGQKLTEDQKLAVFNPGEPNNASGVENCGEFSVNFGKLNDMICSKYCHFICEKPLPMLIEE